MSKDIKFAMTERVLGKTYVHLGFIKPRPTKRVMPWSELGVLDFPKTLTEENLSAIKCAFPINKLSLVSHGNYTRKDLEDFTREFNTHSKTYKVSEIIDDDRELQLVRCAILN